MEEEDDDKADATFDAQQKANDEEKGEKNQGDGETQGNRPIESAPKQVRRSVSDNFVVS